MKYLQVSVASLIFAVSAFTTATVAPPIAAKAWPSCAVRAGSYCTGFQGNLVDCYNCCQQQCVGADAGDLNACEVCCPTHSGC